MVAELHYHWDFIGLSTDEKPTPTTSEKVVDGSTFYCSDTSKLYVWYKTQWYEKTSTGGSGTSYTAGEGIDITGSVISFDGGAEITTETGKDITVENIGGNIQAFELQGDTLQDGTPSTSSPVLIQTATGRQVITVNSSALEVNLGKNIFDKNNPNILNDYYLEHKSDSDTELYASTGMSVVYVEIEPNTTYTISKTLGNRFCIATNPTIPEVNTPMTLGYQDNSAPSLTITSGSNDKYLFFWVLNPSGTTTTLTEVLATVQVEKGSATTYADYFTPIELCKVGDYQDYIYKVGNNWYISKAVAKINSYNEESITTTYISSTGELSEGATVYYGLSSPIVTQITNTNLVAQLEGVLTSPLQLGDNSIVVTSSDLPCDAEVSVYADTVNGRLAGNSYANFTGTDGLSNGTAGLVPAPTADDSGKVLKADGTWGTLPTGDFVTLTSANYTEYGDGSRIQLWKLPVGFYKLADGTAFKVGMSAPHSGNKTARTGDWVIVSYSNNTNSKNLIGTLEETYEISIANLDGSGYNATDDGGALLGASVVKNNLTTSSAGNIPYVLDARQGKALKDMIGDLTALATTVKTDLVSAINELASK